MDDNAYKELIEEEWNDPSAVDCEDIREQLEIDKINFSPFVVSGGPDDVGTHTRIGAYTCVVPCVYTLERDHNV